MSTTPCWHTAIDLKNLMYVSEAVTRAAIERKESRGAQFREDYPEKSAEWGKYNLVLKKEADGSMGLKKVPRIEPTAEQNAIIEEMK